MSSKERLDVLLVNRGLADSREKAKAIIMSGNVYVDGQKEDKAGSSFNETVNIEVRGNTLKYVSRGGLKLEKAMENFDVTIEGKICMDVGSSTGGFILVHIYITHELLRFFIIYHIIAIITIIMSYRHCYLFPVCSILHSYFQACNHPNQGIHT